MPAALPPPAPGRRNRLIIWLFTSFITGVRKDGMLVPWVPAGVFSNAIATSWTMVLPPLHKGGADHSAEPGARRARAAPRPDSSAPDSRRLSVVRRLTGGVVAGGKIIRALPSA